jgi:predicted amidophosphoribosyltransferase
MPSLALPGRWLRRSAAGLLDLLLPPRCLGCGVTIGREGELCPRCWGAIAFLGSPHCACCGLPFPYDAGGDARCGACLADPPPYDRARAVFRYDDASRGLVLAFKHGDKTHSAPAYGRWMARAGAELFADAELLLPVPLHWTRLFARRYNQAALLAHAIRVAGGPPVAPDWLRRRRRTPPHRKGTATLPGAPTTCAAPSRCGPAAASRGVVSSSSTTCSRPARRCASARASCAAKARRASMF